MSPLVFAIATAIVVALVYFEARRQQRKYGKPSGRPNLVGVGLLELQKHLQPDRATVKLEALQKEEDEVEEGQTAGNGANGE